MNEPWANYTAEDFTDPQKRKEVFEVMLRRLEDEGKCRFVFHQLALALFGEDSWIRWRRRLARWIRVRQVRLHTADCAKVRYANGRLSDIDHVCTCKEPR